MPFSTPQPAAEQIHSNYGAFEDLIVVLQQRKLVDPVRWLLELHRPILGLTQAVAMAGIFTGAPLFCLFLGAARYQEISKMLQEPGVLEALLQRLEGLEAA